MNNEEVEQEGKLFLGRSIEPEYMELKFANRGPLPGCCGITRIAERPNMRPTMSAPPPIDSIAVTYRCGGGHHDIRFYRERPISRTVACSVCGCPAVISPEEYARHAELVTTLDEWVA